MKTNQRHRWLTQLRPHPRNSAIYGDEDVTELVELIHQSGWIKPLVVTETGIIISGHRRWKALAILGWDSAPVEVRKFPDELAELEALLLENASRVKTTEQKVREGEVWREIEASKAKIRQTTNLKIGNHTPVQENFPERERGQSRDVIASRIGFGTGRTYQKAAKVIAVIDEDIQKGNLGSAQGLRKVLNEQSVDAAHMLLKKSFQERDAIATLIVSGEAKSTKQAERMIRQNKCTKFNDPFQVTLDGFSVGDWVEVNLEAQNYISCKGQVEQILTIEQQISVSFEGGSAKTRFYSHELTLIAKALPPCPFQIGDIVFVDIGREAGASPHEKKWNTFWGLVRQVGERGSLTVDVGSELLQLLPHDLKLLNTSIRELGHVVERVLRLRHFELDEVEEKMLDVIQRREWLTQRQLDYLDFMEKFYLLNELHTSVDYQVTQCRGP